METALAGWGELAPLIIFLIATALVNRARKKKEEQAAAAEAEAAQQRRQGAPGQASQPQARRQAPAVLDDGEDEEDWEGEDSETWDDHDVRETRSVEGRNPENRGETFTASKAPERVQPADAKRSLPADRGQPKPPVIPEKAKEKAAEVGRDLLSQLAKELGLELPKHGKQAPRPTPAQQAPQAPKAPPRAPERAAPARTQPKSWSTSPDDVRARTVEQSRLLALQESRAAEYQTPALSAPPTGSVASRAVPLAVVRDMGDAEALRRAFILKTVLDKPVSMRPRGPSRD